MKLFRRNKSIARNKKVTKARILYLYVIIGSVVGLVYFVMSIFRGWPKHFALTPVYLLAAFLILLGLYRNWKQIWFFIVNVERGKLLLFLNKATHFEESHKMKVVKWVYPSSRQIRKEIYDKIAEKLFNKEELTDEEKKRMKHRVVFCPQQLKIGFNEALLVHSLIHCHRDILPLDEEIRDLMSLTDDNMLKFDIMKEFDKAGGDKYNKLIEIGKRKSAELNN